VPRIVVIFVALGGSVLAGGLLGVIGWLSLCGWELLRGFISS